MLSNISRPTAGSMRSFKMEILDLGPRRYGEALETQKAVLAARIAGEVPDTLIVTEHYPVVTLGRTSREEDIDRGFFGSQGIDVLESARGGKNTFHGPGQLVLYPVIDIGEKKKDIAFYIDFLERAVARSLGMLGVPASRLEAKRGVWVGGKKIAFIGVAVKKWVTYHGVAVNINNGTGPFRHMSPCGERDIEVTSAKEYLGHEVDMARAKTVFQDVFSNELEMCYGAETAGIIERRG